MKINWALVANLWTALGPLAGALIGVVVGAFVTKRNQRTDWLRECKKEEYKELLRGIGNTLSSFVLAQHRAIPSGIEREQFLMSSWSSTAQTLYGSVFIVPELAKINLYSRWIKALNLISKTYIDDSDANLFSGMLNDMRAAAKRDVEDASWE